MPRPSVTGRGVGGAGAADGSATSQGRAGQSDSCADRAVATTSRGTANAAETSGVPSDPPATVRGISAESAPGAGATRDGSDPDGGRQTEPADWAQFGPLAPYVAAEGVTDVFVNGSSGLWVDYGGGAVHDPDWACDERALRALAVRLVALADRHVDEANPCVDVRLAAGIRVHVVLPPVSTTGTLVSIRVPRRSRFSLTQLEQAGMVGIHRARLDAAIAARANLLITGAAGSGKTTLLSAMLAQAPAGERIVCIEDVAELQVRHPHVIALEARQANVEGIGAIGLDRLVREALRMRPDRLVVGECRGAEVRELMSALNTGHDGGAGTLHANSIDDVPARLEALGALAGLDASAVARQAVSAFDLVVHVERAAGVRRIACCGAFELDASGRLLVRELRP